FAPAFPGMSVYGKAGNHSAYSLGGLLPPRRFKFGLGLWPYFTARLATRKQRIYRRLKHIEGKTISVPWLRERKICDLFDLIEQLACNFIPRGFRGIKGSFNQTANFVTQSPFAAFFLQPLVQAARKPQCGLDHVFRLAD